MAAAPGIVTSGVGPPNAAVTIQPGMVAQPVVLVDQNGNFVTSSGSLATAGYLATQTTSVYVAGGSAPTTGQELIATSGTTATWQFGASGVLTTLGDMLFENSTPALARLAGNTSTTKMFLTQTGNGTVSANPAWGTIASTDLPPSVALTGSPTATTASAGDNTTRIATDAFVTTATGDPWGIGANLNYVPPDPAATLLAMNTASVAVWTRFFVYGYSMSSVYVDIGVQSGSVATAIYAPSAGNPLIPGNQVATSGGTACPAPGVQALALGSAVTIGRGYWIAFVADNTTATFRQLSGAIIPGSSTWILAETVTGVALPASGTAATAAAGVGVRYPIMSSVQP
jgi:hypothetical protein